MSFLVIRNSNKDISIAYKVKHGYPLLETKSIIQRIYPEVELITISRPSAYAEYEPYVFINNIKDCIDKIQNILYT